MPKPEGYCYINAPEDARDKAREIKQARDQTWGEFLIDAADALDTEN